METKQIFISFSTKETAEAQRICKLLEEHGFHCFICLRDLIAGEEYAAQLIDNLGQSAAMVLLLSQAANTSPHVLSEVEYAVRKKIPLLVYALEDVELTKSMEYFLMTHQWILPTEDRDARLLAGLNYFLERPETTSENASPITAPSKDTAVPAAVPKRISPLWLIPLVLLIIGLGFTIEAVWGEQSPSSQKESALLQEAYALGDTLTFGTYNEEPIKWRVIQIKEDNTLLLLSQNILTFKVFDAAEGGKYNECDDKIDYWSFANHEVNDPELLRNIRGNNDWSISNLRTWLNSDGEVVTYTDQAPDLQAVGSTYYNTEPGFLHQFTKEEKEDLVPVTNFSAANCFSTNIQNDSIKTIDSVFLLSSQELSLLETAGISLYAAPSESCLKQDEGKSDYNAFHSVYGVSNYYWWLRDNDRSKLNLAYAVATEVNQNQKYISDSVGICAYGVRPAICVKADSLLLQK